VVRESEFPNNYNVMMEILKMEMDVTQIVKLKNISPAKVEV